MSATRLAGYTLCGGVGTWFVKHFGWSALLLLITVLMWAVMLLVIEGRQLHDFA